MCSCTACYSVFSSLVLLNARVICLKVFSSRAISELYKVHSDIHCPFVFAGCPGMSKYVQVCASMSKHVQVWYMFFYIHIHIICNIYYLSVATWLKEFSSSGAWRPSTLRPWNGTMLCRVSYRIGGTGSCHSPQNSTSSEGTIASTFITT